MSLGAKRHIAQHKSMVLGKLTQGQAHRTAEVHDVQRGSPTTLLRREMIKYNRSHLVVASRDGSKLADPTLSTWKHTSQSTGSSSTSSESIHILLIDQAERHWSTILLVYYCYVSKYGLRQSHEKTMQYVWLQTSLT